jgi:hypothetical protein
MPTDTEERILATDPRIRLPDRDARRVLGRGFFCEKNEGNESLKNKGAMAPERAKGATRRRGPARLTAGGEVVEDYRHVSLSVSAYSRAQAPVSAFLLMAVTGAISLSAAMMSGLPMSPA